MPRKKQVRQQNIKYDNQNTKYANQNTKYANQKFTLFCREAIFVANLRTFLAYFLQAKKYGGVPKRTNIRYADNAIQPIYVTVTIHPVNLPSSLRDICVCPLDFTWFILNFFLLLNFRDLSRRA